MPTDGAMHIVAYHIILWELWFPVPAMAENGLEVQLLSILGNKGFWIWMGGGAAIMSNVANTQLRQFTQIEKKPMLTKGLIWITILPPNWPHAIKAVSTHGTTWSFSLIVALRFLRITKLMLSCPTSLDGLHYYNEI